MRTLARFVAVVVVAVLACGRAPAADGLPREVRCMLESYPAHLCGFESGALVTCDGEHITWDDGREKTLWERFLEPDPEDVFVYPYPATYAWPPAPKDDPGIIRYEPLMVRMLGGTAREVERRLVRVKWFGRSVRMAPDAAAALASVAAELKKLPARQHKFFRKTAGTFNWRAIKGSDVRSLHSYGLAIDVGVPYADYWRWAGLDPKKFGPPAYRNRFPREVVEAFERHGFVWGGRWSWFDTMHFEYRPELLCARRDPAFDPRAAPRRERARAGLTALCCVAHAPEPAMSSFHPRCLIVCACVLAACGGVGDAGPTASAADAAPDADAGPDATPRPALFAPEPASAADDDPQPAEFEDHNPDPAVVEVDLTASETTQAYLPGAPTRV